MAGRTVYFQRVTSVTIQEVRGKRARVTTYEIKKVTYKGRDNKTASEIAYENAPSWIDVRKDGIAKVGDITRFIVYEPTPKDRKEAYRELMKPKIEELLDEYKIYVQKCTGWLVVELYDSAKTTKEKHEALDYTIHRVAFILRYRATITPEYLENYLMTAVAKRLENTMLTLYNQNQPKTAIECACVYAPVAISPPHPDEPFMKIIKVKKEVVRQLEAQFSHEYNNKQQFVRMTVDQAKAILALLRLNTHVVNPTLKERIAFIDQLLFPEK